jgi:catechol 2,3-dioxygenase-like lactoylglutathione lyase family enzyme
VGGPSTWEGFAASNGQGIHHIALLTENTDKELEFYRRKNINVLQQGHWETGRYTYVDTFEKLGTCLELLEFFPKPSN